MYLSLQRAHLFLQVSLGLLFLLQLLLQAVMFILQLPQTSVQRQLLTRLLLKNFLRDTHTTERVRRSTPHAFTHPIIKQ